jgi:hypothetical protein
MASRLKERQKHPFIPGLVRLPQTAAQEVYPYLKSAGVPQRVRARASKGNLSGAERGHCSPLDGRAASEGKGKP